MVLELLFEYGEHESSSVAQILNVVPNIPYFELGCPETNIDPGKDPVNEVAIKHDVTACFQIMGSHCLLPFFPGYT